MPQRFKAETFAKNLASKKVDSIITILYDYDNERLPVSIRAVIWNDKGKGKVRIIQGCDRITKDTTFAYNLLELWNYIDHTKFDDASIPIKSGNGQLHDMFYHITVATPTKFFIVVVRDNEREKTERHKTPEIDSKVMITKKVDAILK